MEGVLVDSVGDSAFLSRLLPLLKVAHQVWNLRLECVTHDASHINTRNMRVVPLAVPDDYMVLEPEMLRIPRSEG